MGAVRQDGSLDLLGRPPRGGRQHLVHFDSELVPGAFAEASEVSGGWDGRDAIRRF